MNIALFFITFLFTTVSGISLKKLNADLEAFMATADTADPSKIQELRNMVAQLISEGEGEEAAFTETRDIAQSVLDQKTSDLTDATAALDDAIAVQSAATTKKTNAIALEAQKRQTRADKFLIKEEKKGLLDEATATDEKEQLRLDNEKALFEQVDSMLVGVQVSDRRLLSSENADPAQVYEARQLIQNLIDAGEAERRELIANLAAAQQAFDTASDIFSLSVNDHILADGALQDAILELKDAVDVFDLRTSEHESAITDKQAADNDLAVKQTKLDDESARIASERLDLEMIDGLLVKLNDE